MVTVGKKNLVAIRWYYRTQLVVRFRSHEFGKTALNSKRYAYIFVSTVLNAFWNIRYTTISFSSIFEILMCFIILLVYGYVELFLKCTENVRMHKFCIIIARSYRSICESSWASVISTYLKVWNHPIFHNYCLNAGVIVNPQVPPQSKWQHF